MDKELQRLLEEARSRGASTQQLDDILARYNSKKKEQPEEPFQFGVSDTGSLSPSQEVKEPTEDVAVDRSPTIGEWFGNIWNGLSEGVTDFLYPAAESTGLTDKNILSFVKQNQEEYPDLFEAYEKSLSNSAIQSNFTGEKAEELAARTAYSQYWESDPSIEDKVVPFIRGERREEAVKKTGVEIPQDIKRDLDEQFWNSSLKGLASSLPAMVASSPTAGGSFVVQSYYAREEEIARTLDENPDLEMTEAQKEAYKVTGALVEGALEKIGLSGALKGSPALTKLVTAGVIDKALKGTKKVGKETLDRYINETVQEVGKRIAGGTLAEAETGALQQLSDDALKAVVNTAQGEEFFEPKSLANVFKDALYAGAQEAVGGGLISSVSLLGTSSNERKLKDIDNEIENLKQKRDAAATEEEKTIIDDVITDLTEEQNKEREESFKVYSKFSEQDLIEVQELNNQIREVSSKYNVATSETLKAKYKQEVDDLRARKQELENKYSEEKVRYIKDGKEFSKGEFVEMINKATPEEIATGQWGVENDAEVEQLLLNKLPQDDSKKEERVPSTEQKEEAPKQAEPIQEGGVEAPPTGGVVQEAKQLTLSDGTAVQEGIQVVAKNPVDGSDIQGTIILEGDPDNPRVSVETETDIVELGTSEDINPADIKPFTAAVAETETLTANEDGTLTYNKEGNPTIAKGTNLTIDTDKGLAAVSVFSEGKFVPLTEDADREKGLRVQMVNQDGETVQLYGQDALDATYNIMLAMNEAETQQLNKLLDNEETINAIAEAEESARKDSEPAEEAKRPAVKEARTEKVETGKDLAKELGIKPFKKTNYIEVKDLGKDERTPKRFTEKEINKLQTMVGNFSKTLNRVGAKPVKITFASNNEQFETRYRELTGVSETGVGKKGSFISEKGEIIINLSKADASTLPHEMLHAYVASVKLNPKKISEFTNIIEADLRKGTALEVKLAKDLAAFRDEYVDKKVYGDKKKDDAIIAEEFLAQYVGVMSAYAEQLPPAKQISFIDKVRAAIVKFLAKLGVVDKSLVAKIETREEALNFINGFVDALQGRVAPTVNPESSAVVNSKNPYEASRLQMDVPVGSRIANEPLEEARSVAISYMESKGLKHTDGKLITKLDKKLAKRISDAYTAMKNNPKDTEVAAAYKAMAEETLDQHEAIIKAGYKVEVNNNEPYNNSNELIEDLRKNKNMRIFSTDSGFGDEGITAQQRKDNPMLAETKYKDVNGRTLLVNDIFRFVHDFFGHAERGNGFGPIGEENAWDVHSRMFSPLARKALTAETRGQNSYVNFSGVNDEAFKIRDKGRELRKEGKFEEAKEFTDKAYSIMKYAPQKVGLLPDEFVENPYLEEVQESEPIAREQIDAVNIISADTPKQKAKKEAVAEVLNGFAESQLPPNSSEEDLISRFLNNVFEESLYTLKKGPRESGMTWYIEDITEFENKMTALLPELSDPNQMKLFKQVLAITSSGTNPNQNLQTAYTLWVRSNANAVNFAKNWGEDKISFITKKGVAIGTGIIVRETKTKYVVQKVDALGEPEVFKNGTPKLFEAKKSDLKAGYPKPAGFTARGNIVAQQLTKIEKVYEALGKDINKLIEFFENPQPVSELRKYNKGVPDIDGNVRKVAVGKRNGAFIFGEKIGAFYQNMIGIGDTITMDLWWSRTWNRYMGTMLSTVDNKKVIQETPRTDRERDVMRKAVTLAAKKLNLDVSELQAVIWYFEQELWTKAGNVSPSFSYVTATDALNNKIKTDEQTQKRFSEAGADLTAAEKRRQDAIARANNIIAEGGIQGDVARQQIDWQPSLFGRGQVNPAIVNRTTDVQQAAAELLQGKITNAEYQEIVRVTQPIEAITNFYLPASTKDMKEALQKNKAELLNSPVEDGQEIGLRLDIPAYKDKNIWVVSVHGKGKSGKSISYGSVAQATDVVFGSNPKVASFIAAGKNMDTLKKQDKTTIARMLGKWKNFEGKTKEEKDASAIKKVEEIVKIENSYPGAARKGSPWRQIGMNPFRHSYFYDRRNGKPVVGAAEVVQVGGLVYAKDVEYADWSDDQFTVNGYYDADGQPVRFQLDTDESAKVEKEAFAALEKGEISAPLYKKTWYQRVYSALFRTELEKGILKLQEKKEARISKTEEDAREIANRIKKYAKTPKALELANEYLTSENKKDAKEAILNLPKGQQLLNNLRTARAFVDNISDELVNDPAFDGLDDELRLAIQDNLTTYLRTQYRFFTDKSFDINKRRDAAVQAQFNQLLAQEIGLLSAMGMSPLDIQTDINKRRSEIADEAAQMIDGYISDLQDIKYQPSQGGAGIKMPNAPFRRKKDLPDYIQQLLGKEKDPVRKFAQTADALANILYKGRMIDGIIDLIEKDSDYILEEEPKSPKDKQYTKVNDPYSKLNGKWVHNEVMDMVNQKSLYSSDNPFAKGYFTTLKIARKSKVIWNITTWRKNLTGGWYFILANGIANPRFAKDFTNRTKLMFNVRGEKFQVDEETKRLMNIMADKGVSGKNIDANLIGVSQAAFQFALDGDENKYYQRAKMVLNNIVNKDKWLQEKYAAVDDYTKLIIFRSEIQTYAKKLYGKEYSELNEAQQDNVHEEAAERVKQSTPTFSRLPKWFNKVAGAPIIGDFISFRLESLRSYGMNVSNAVSDIKKSQEAGLSDTQKKAYLQAGLRRLAGSGTVFALKLAIVKVLTQLFLGDDEEDLEDDVKKLRPQWMDGQSIIPRSIDRDGNVRVYNYSSEDPYGDVSDIFGGPESWGAMVTDFVRPNIAADLIFNLSKGQDIYGNKIADYSDTKVNQTLDVLGYTAKQIIVPPTISSSFRDAWLKSELPKKDRAINLASTIAERSIIRDYKYNVINSLYQDVNKISETRKSYLDYDNPAKRLRQLDEIREQYDAIVAIAFAKDNDDLIRKAERALNNLDEVDREYVYEENR